MSSEYQLCRLELVCNYEELISCSLIQW